MAAAQCLPSAADIRSTFERYFSIGYGIADSLRLYRINASLDNDLPGSNTFLFPNYRTVRHWHTHWSNIHGDIHGSTSSNNNIKEPTLIPMTSIIVQTSSSVEELGQGEDIRVKMSEFLDSNILPRSFVNKIIHVDDRNCLSHFRSDVNCVQDCILWIKEFRERSLTKWILHSQSRNPPQKVVCRLTFVCQHSSYEQKQRPRSKHNKNFNCNATINIVVENADNDSHYVQEGLPALIVLQNTHSHATTTAVTPSFLSPTNDIRMKFEQYFSKGLGIASSLQYYKQNLKSASSHLNIPKYSVVKQWYKKWRAVRTLPKIEDTSVADDELSECGYFKEHSLKMSEYLDIHFLPKSFKNQILEVDDIRFLAHIRSNVNCVQDCIYWVKEFGERSSTKWVLNSCSQNPPPEVICWRSFICHHSSYWKKKDAVLNSNKSNMNLNCKAKITFVVQSPVEENSFVKEGLPALIVLKNNHNHPITTTALSVLPPEDGTQAKFKNYFSNGFSISESILYHTANLKDTTSDVKIPKYGTVKMWHTKWLEKCLGPDLYNSLSEISDSKSTNSLCETIVEMKSPQPMATETNRPAMVRTSADEIKDRDFQLLLEEFKKCHLTFGMSQVTHHKLLKRLKSITARDAWDMFLCTAST